MNCRPVSFIAKPPRKTSDEAGKQGLGDRRGAIPAGHVRLACPAFDGADDVPRDVLGADDETAHDRIAQDRCLRKTLRFDKAGIHRVDADAARRKLGCDGS
jgi:hypothetical protein